MANARRSLRSDPFIQQDPNAPRYSQRLSREQWGELKPVVLMLFGQGASTVDILRQLQSQHILITRSQLDGQMKKWGFRKFNYESSHLAMRASRNIATSKSINDTSRFLTPNSAVTRADSNPESNPLQAQPTSSFEPTTESQIADSQYTTDMLETDTTTPNSLPVPHMPAPDLRDDFHPRLRLTAIDSDDLSVIHRIFSYSVTKHGSSIKVLNRLGYMAMLLFTLKCYSEAFQISLHIVDQLNHEAVLQEFSRPLLSFFVINCARFARTYQEQEAANSLVRQTYDWLLNCYPSGQKADQQTPYMQVLHDLVAGTVHERDKTTAHWILNAVFLSLQDDEHYFQQDPFCCLGPESALRFFYEDGDIRNLMDGAIGEIQECLYANRKEIDGVWGKYWQFPEDDLFMGQTLACLLLRPRLGHGFERFEDWVAWESAEDLRQTESFSRLREQVLVAMCILIGKLYWSRWISVRRPSGPVITLKLSQKLFKAALAIERAIKSRTDVEGNTLDIPIGADDYEGYIDLYLCELDSSKKVLWKKRCDEHLVGITALLAKVSTVSDLEALRIPYLALTRHGRSVFPLNHPPNPATGASTSRQTGHGRGFSTADSPLGPPLARSYVSSTSSGYKSFKALAAERGAPGPKHPPTIPSVPSANWPEPLSWKFHNITGLPSMHGSLVSIRSDTSMRDSDDYAVDEDIIW